MRTLKYLKYIGNKETGSMQVVQVDSRSPERTFKYYKDMKLVVGKDVSEKVADVVSKYHPTLFKIESTTLDDNESFLIDFEILLNKHEHMTKKEIISCLSLNGFMFIAKTRPKQKKKIETSFEFDKKKSRMSKKETKKE